MHGPCSTHWPIQASDTGARRSAAAAYSSVSIHPTPWARPHAAATPSRRRHDHMPPVRPHATGRPTHCGHAHTLSARPHTSETPRHRQNTRRFPALPRTARARAHRWHAGTPHRRAHVSPGRLRITGTPAQTGAPAHHLKTGTFSPLLQTSSTRTKHQHTELPPTHTYLTGIHAHHQRARQPPTLLPTAASPENHRCTRQLWKCASVLKFSTEDNMAGRWRLALPSAVMSIYHGSTHPRRHRPPSSAAPTFISRVLGRRPRPPPMAA